MNHRNSLKYLTLTTLIALVISGCTTIDPYTGEEKISNTTIGAGTGAALGAGLGALIGGSGDRLEGALIGAGIGALAGGSVGYYMDEQEAKLRRQLRGTGVSVSRYGDKIILNMPSNITFDTGKATIKSHFFPALNSVGLVLQEYKSTYVEVAGHTDNVGTTHSNQLLSEQRAESVATYLRSQGVHPARLITRGYGESRPTTTNASTQGRAANRRVEITLSPIS